MCLLVIHISSLVNYLFKSFVCFLIRLFIFFLLTCKGSLYILDINHFSDTGFTNIFSHAVACLFIFFRVPFEVQQFGIWMKFGVSMYFVNCAFGVLTFTLTWFCSVSKIHPEWSPFLCPHCRHLGASHLQLESEDCTASLCPCACRLLHAAHERSL